MRVYEIIDLNKIYEYSINYFQKSIVIKRLIKLVMYEIIVQIKYFKCVQ